MQPLDLRQVARRMNVDYKTAWRWVRSGKLKAFKTPGGEWRVRPEDLERKE